MGLKKNSTGFQKESSKFKLFPVKDSVPCYMTNVDIRVSRKGQVIIDLTFRDEDDAYLNTSLFRPMENEENFQEKAQNFMKSLEHLLYLYLDNEDMRYVLKNSEKSPEKYIKLCKEKLKEKRFWQTKIEIKTLINAKKEVVLPRYTPFARLYGNETVPLEYTKWENGYNRKNIYKY